MTGCPRSRENVGPPSCVIAALAAAFVILLFAASSERFHHWFVVPVFVCGVLAGTDAVDWLRSKVDLFDPVGIMGLFTTFTLFVSPLLHVEWDVWMWEVTPPADWREWVGRMAVINVVAMIAYAASRAFFLRRGCRTRSACVWRPDPKIFWSVALLLLFLTGSLQMWAFARHGGILAYIADFQNADNRHMFEGMGPMFIISESFPIVFAVVFVVFMKTRRIRQHWLVWAGFLLVFFVLRMICGGLRGSRLVVVVSLFWITGTIHYLVRPISRRLVACGTAGILVFMYVFLFYKDGGDVTKILSAQERESVYRTNHRSLEGMLLGDLGRTDVQAYVLYKLMSDPEQFTYARGDTYLFAASLLIPRSLVPVRPTDKTVYGADLMYGPGSFVRDEIWSSKIYGLAGESMLNFSPLAVPFAFVFLGFLVARVQSFIHSLPSGDFRFVLAPLAVFMCVWVYVADSDVVVFQMFANGFVVTCFVLVTARRMRRVPLRTPAAGGRQDPFVRMGENNRDGQAFAEI